MRTTLSLDPDVAARLKAEARRIGRPFKVLVNEILRAGMARTPRQRFRVETRSLGGLQPGISFDNIGELLDQVEGPHHR